MKSIYFISKSRSDSGFTLIELLVTVAIIGVLASIAIPEFTEYRKKAYDVKSVSVMANVIVSQEASFADNGSYTALDSLPGFSHTNASLLADGFNFDLPDVFVVKNGDPVDAFSFWIYHEKGSKTYCHYGATGAGVYVDTNYREYDNLDGDGNAGCV